MKRGLFLAVIWLLLASCTGGPTPAPPTEIPTGAPPATADPTDRPPPTGTLPATWTPAAAGTPQPTWTRVSLPTPELTAAPATGSWPPGLIPNLTLTPTPVDSVPGAAGRAYSAAQSAFEAGDLDRALASVDEALALVPEHTDFLALRGRVLLAQGHPLQGETELRTALSYDPFNEDARQALADLYVRYDRWRDAEAEYERYLTLIPGDPAGWFALGNAREAQGELEPAIAAYSETLQLDPIHTDALRRRGDLWRTLEAYRPAWSDYTALLAIVPSADLYETRAEINLWLESPLLAAADFQSAISLTLPTGSPTETLMIEMGRAYLAGGAATRAASVFSATLHLTDTVQVRLLLGESLLAGGIYTDALEIFAAALPMAEPAQTAAVLIGQGRALLAAGRAEGAEEALGSALDFATSADERAEILRWRSRAYLALADHERALADLVAAEELAPHPLYRLWKAEIYEASGQIDGARDELAAFLREVDPEEVDPDVVAAAEEQLAALTEAP